eukprot:6188425-Pleurochrysis_carterae.AAC.1
MGGGSSIVQRKLAPVRIAPVRSASCKDAPDARGQLANGNTTLEQSKSAAVGRRSINLSRGLTDYTAQCAS